jgi:serine/threonine protein kinase
MAGERRPHVLRGLYRVCMLLILRFDFYLHFGVRPYRAPELLLGLRCYDAPAIDMWSFGAVYAEFFSAMYCIAGDGYGEEPGDIDPYIKVEDDNSNPFEISPSVMNNPEDIKWDRKSLFNGSRGEIGLIGSIFKIRGTPTEETWPVRSISGIHPARGRAHSVCRDSRLSRACSSTFFRPFPWVLYYPTCPRSLPITLTSLTSVYRVHHRPGLERKMP